MATANKTLKTAFIFSYNALKTDVFKG